LIILKYSFAYFKSDLFAGLIVFLVALPLCHGIALASGAPLLSAVICGIIGGIVVGIISQSQVSVSGPAAGLTAIVLAAISSLGSFELFLTSVVLAGMIQLLLGLMKAGSLSNYIPSGVIEGMLAGIGVIIILKQIPYAIGFTDTVRSIHPGAVVVSLFSVAVLIAFRQIQLLQKFKTELMPLCLSKVIYLSR
jgi:MFS superfamily sulfate permease-like transporter